MAAHVFVDRLTAFSVLATLRAARSAGAVWWFDPPTPWGDRVYRALRRLGLASYALRRVDHHVGEMRGAGGRSEVVDTFEDVRGILATIRENALQSSRMLQRLGSRWSLPRVVLHLERRIDPHLCTECLRIRLVAWIARQGRASATCAVSLWIAPSVWRRYLRPYAVERDVRLHSYFVIPGLHSLGRFRRVAGTFVRRVVRRSGTPLPGAGVEPKPHQPPADSLPTSPRSAWSECGATVGVRYWYRPLGFAPDRGTEFFWVPVIPDWKPSLVLYEYNAATELRDEERRELAKWGVRVFGRAPDVIAWRPTRGFVSAAVRNIAAVVGAAIAASVRGSLPSRYVLVETISLAARIAYWEDFFRATGIRVNVACLNGEVAQTIALAAIGGVSVAYQYSASNMVLQSALLTAGDDIQFVFSPTFEAQWRRVGCADTHYIRAGYIFDYTATPVERSKTDRRLRKQLEEAGATFVVCFFDENSVDRWDSPVPHTHAVRDYEFFLRWALEDPGLGLVFKPKKPDTLAPRIAPIADLVERAKATGRCLFLNELPEGVFPPARAAQLADVCVGKLIGSTAALESALTGVPTLLVDPDGYTNHPFYEWAIGCVLFREWSELRAALDRYRQSPRDTSGFGDWAPGMAAMAAPIDGMARLRIGLVVQRLSETLAVGASRAVAIAEAIALCDADQRASHGVRPRTTAARAGGDHEGLPSETLGSVRT